MGCAKRVRLSVKRGAEVEREEGVLCGVDVRRVVCVALCVCCVRRVVCVA